MGDWRRSHCTAAHSSWGRKQTDTHKRNQGDAHQPILLVWLGGSLLAVVQLKTLCPPSLRVRAETQDDHTASFLHLDTLQVKGGTPISYVGTSGVVCIPGQMVTLPRPCLMALSHFRSCNRNKPIWTTRKTENQDKGISHTW